ncbi:MAG: NADH-quinone oxidoreductase subunit C [Kineosporiaceae bacterium]
MTGTPGTKTPGVGTPGTGTPGIGTPQVRARDLLAPFGAEITGQDAGGVWARAAGPDIRAVVRQLRDSGVRLVTLTALPDPETEEAGTYRLISHWDLGPALLNLVSTVTPQSPPSSIADLIPGADWAEREIRDFYAVDFTGRTGTPGLMLREGDPAGLFSRTGTLGRDTDPAATARQGAERAGAVAGSEQAPAESEQAPTGGAGPDAAEGEPV